MFSWRHMLEIPNILRPQFWIRIHRPGDHESTLIEMTRRSNQQIFERGVPVRRIGSKIRQVRNELVAWVNSIVKLRVDPAVQRRDAARTEPVAKLLESLPTCITQNQIELT